jgi:hypothetical protein
MVWEIAGATFVIPIRVRYHRLYHLRRELAGLEKSRKRYDI